MNTQKNIPFKAKLFYYKLKYLACAKQILEYKPQLTQNSPSWFCWSIFMKVTRKYLHV